MKPGPMAEVAIRKMAAMMDERRERMNSVGSLDADADGWTDAAHALESAEGRLMADCSCCWGQKSARQRQLRQQGPASWLPAQKQARIVGAERRRGAWGFPSRELPCQGFSAARRQKRADGTWQAGVADEALQAKSPASPSGMGAGSYGFCSKRAAA
jgi:hypothetical protein